MDEERLVATLVVSGLLRAVRESLSPGQGKRSQRVSSSRSMLYVMTDRPTLSIRLSGGFGNQLFQYCAGLAVSRRWSRQLYLDRSWYRFSNYRPSRPYRLGQFSIPNAARPASAIGDFALLLLDQCVRQSSAVRRVVARAGATVIVERDGHSKPDYLYATSPANQFVSLSGCWQTVDHFLDVQCELRRFLQPEFELSPNAIALKSPMSAGETGFLHVRRGDFVTLGHPLLPISYYENSVKVIEERIGQRLRWLVFSDDPEWCRNEMRFLPDPVFVNLTGLMADLEEFQIMRACQHGVIANSSFSWWAAALIENPDAIVCAPKNRYGEMGGADIQKERVLPWWILIE